MSSSLNDIIAAKDQEFPLGVSIILFTFNSRLMVEETIKHIIQLSRNEIPVELLLLDNHSEDDTISLAERLLAQSNWSYRIIDQQKPGLFHSRVAGIKAAKYRYFIFVDDDNYLMGDWIPSVIHLMEEKTNVALVGGVNEAKAGADLPAWWESQKHAFAVGRANNETGPVYSAFAALWGAGLAGRTALVRMLYEKVNFWLVGRTGNRLLAGEDSELSYWARLLGFTIYQSELPMQHVIAPRKLTKEYLLGIHRGFRYSDHYLLQYRIALTGESWFLEMLKYGIWLKLKWLMAPIRLGLTSNEVKRVDILTKAPTFSEVLFFWKRWRHWRTVYTQILKLQKELQNQN